jgi:hypothetical protein
MKIKLIKDLNLIAGPIIPKGEICTVRVFSKTPVQFNAPYQVIDGNYSGHFIPREYCIDHPEEKTYSLKALQKIENYHIANFEKERQAKDRAIELVTNLSKQMVKKNAEIEKLEFCVSALSIGLSASSEAIAILRETAKQNG